VARGNQAAKPERLALHPEDHATAAGAKFVVPATARSAIEDAVIVRDYAAGWI